VLIDVMVQNTVQSTKHFDRDTGGVTTNAFDAEPILVAGPVLAVGYGLW